VTDNIWQKSFTPVEFPDSDLHITPGDKWFLCGSCFAEELAGYLESRFLNHHFSPMGITYNPLSIAESLQRISLNRPVVEKELLEYQNLWMHSLFHGERNHSDKQIYLSKLNQDLHKAYEGLIQSRLLVLTLGTAWVYREKSNGRIVNNCHRRPAELFQRDILKIEEMKQSLATAIGEIQYLNPSIDIVITVSPVRHLRDDARQNSLSKARLICTAQELAQELPAINYFPSWEIMMDELRDYRWYSENLKTPSAAALSYIMERFMKWAGTPELQSYLKEASKLRKRLNHRFTGRQREQEKKFREETSRQVDKLQKIYPQLSLPID